MITGLDAIRYADLVTAFRSGVHSPTTLNDFVRVVLEFNDMESLTSTSKPLGSANKVSTPAQDPSSALAPASTPAQLDKFSGTNWISEDGRTLLTKFKCHICRNNKHTWPTCPHLVHWNITRKDSHPKKNTQPSSEGGSKDDKGGKVGKSCAVTFGSPLF